MTGKVLQKFVITVTTELSFHRVTRTFKFESKAEVKEPLSFFDMILLSSSGHFAVRLSLTVPVAKNPFSPKFSKREYDVKKLSKSILCCCGFSTTERSSNTTFDPEIFLGLFQ